MAVGACLRRFTRRVITDPPLGERHGVRVLRSSTDDWLLARTQMPPSRTPARRSHSTHYTLAAFLIVIAALCGVLWLVIRANVHARPAVADLADASTVFSVATRAHSTHGECTFAPHGVFASRLFKGARRLEHVTASDEYTIAAPRHAAAIGGTDTTLSYLWSAPCHVAVHPTPRYITVVVSDENRVVERRVFTRDTMDHATAADVVALLVWTAGHAAVCEVCTSFEICRDLVH